MANVEEFLDAGGDGNLPHVQKMLADGYARITDADEDGETALLVAAMKSDAGSLSLTTLKGLLEEGGARITERNRYGNTALLMTADFGKCTACQWLLEYGRGDIEEANDAGQTV
jgi:ankyrin repeat protein